MSKEKPRRVCCVQSCEVHLSFEAAQAFACAALCIFSAGHIRFVERISALGAELGRMRRVFRLPAALVALGTAALRRLGLPHSAQNLPLFTAPQQTQPSGCAAGFFVPHSGQKLPVAAAPPHCGHFQSPAAGFARAFAAAVRAEIAGDALWPHVHVQPAGAAGAGCAAGALRAHLIERFCAFMPPAPPAMFMPINAIAGPAF